MTDYPVGRGYRSADLPSRLRLAALAAVIAGVVLLAAAAFVLSYGGIHLIALRAGVSPALARLYPLILDAMLVVAGSAALALRGARLWARGYAWAALIVLLAAVAAGDAVHAMGTALPSQATRAAVAVIPWALVLLAFGLLLEMLRHSRRTRALGREAVTAAAAPAEPGNGAAAPGGVNGGAPGDRLPVTWASGGGGAAQPLPRPRAGLDELLGPRPGQPPPVIRAAGDTGAAAVGAGPGAGLDTGPAGHGGQTGHIPPEGSAAGHESPGGHAAAGDSAPASGPASAPGETGQRAGGSSTDPRGAAAQPGPAGEEPQAGAVPGTASGAAASSAAGAGAATGPADSAAATPATGAATSAAASPASGAGAAPAGGGPGHGQPADGGPGHGQSADGGSGHGHPADGADSGDSLERMRSTPTPPGPDE